MTLRAAVKQQQKEHMERFGVDAAEDLIWRFPDREAQIRAAAWAWSHFNLDTDNDHQCQAMLKALGLKWCKLPMGSVTLAPVEWPDHIYRDDTADRYYTKDGAGNKTYLGLAPFTAIIKETR